MKVTAIVRAAAVAAVFCALPNWVLRAEAQSTAAPKSQWVWVKHLQIEFKPSAEQVAMIGAAMAKGEKPVVVQLTPDQANWVKTNYGFAVTTTKVVWPKTTPDGFKVTVTPDYAIEFRDFYAMDCGAHRGANTCTARRYKIQVEMRPTGQRPEQAVLDALKIAPVFTPSQRQSIEQAKRAGTPEITIPVSQRQQAAFSAMSSEPKAGKTKVELMQLTPDAKTRQNDQLHALGCTMNWVLTSDPYGDHELCYPQCD